jgi:hypothetical protein
MDKTCIPKQYYTLGYTCLEEISLNKVIPKDIDLDKHTRSKIALPIYCIVGRKH